MIETEVSGTDRIVLQPIPRVPFFDPHQENRVGSASIALEIARHAIQYFDREGKWPPPLKKHHDSYAYSVVEEGRRIDSYRFLKTGGFFLAIRTNGTIVIQHTLSRPTREHLRDPF